jgi:hypothetical protein
MTMDKAKAPAADLKSLGQALVRLGTELPLPLPPGCELRVVTAAQGALLDFFADNPYCTVEGLDVHAGDPELVRLRLSEAAVKKIKLAR